MQNITSLLQSWTEKSVLCNYVCKPVTYVTGIKHVRSGRSMENVSGRPVASQSHNEAYHLLITL